MSVQTRIRVYPGVRDQARTIWAATELAAAGDIVELRPGDITPIDHRYTSGKDWAIWYPWFRPELHYSVTGENLGVCAAWRDLLDALAEAWAGVRR